MRSDNLNQNQASLILQVCPSQISTEKLEAAVASGREKLSLGEGPASLLAAVEEELVCFVDEWCSKGLLSCVSLL